MVTKFDKIFDDVGHCGRYQLVLYVLLGVIPFIVGLHAIAIFFIAGNPDHWCRIPELHNLSFAEQKLIGIPLVGETYSRCQRFNLDFFSSDDFASWNVSDRSDRLNQTGTIACGSNGWVYDNSWWLSTIVEQFDLVCDREWIVAMANTAFMAGLMVGCLVFGALADRIGRHRVLMISLGLTFVFALAAAFSPRVEVFVILRVLCAVANAGAYTSSFVLIVELMGPKHRMKLAIWIQGFFGFGFMIVPGIAYFIRNHVTLQIVIACPCVLLLSYYWLIPESPRWLITQKRLGEAEKILRKIARRNKQDAGAKIIITEEIIMPSCSKEKENTATFLDLLRTPNMRKKSLNLCFNWFVNSIVYYGLSFSSGSFGDNIYLNIFLGGLVELPAYLVTMLVLDRFGRRYIQTTAMVAGGVACLGCMPLLANKASPILLAVAIFGKFCISASFAIIYLWTAELYPTVIRTAGVGSGSMSARIGGLVAPQVALLVKVWMPLPTLVFGVLSILAGFLALLLPETLHRNLPETIEEGERFGRKSEGTTESPETFEDERSKVMSSDNSQD